MKQNEEVVYRNRKIYFNIWDEFCVCHMHGGMVCYNASFDSLPKAKQYIDTIVTRRDLMKEDFERIANEIKRVHNSMS